MAELLALGVSHKTAPLELRERLSLTEGRAVGALRRADRGRRDPRGGGDLDLQPHRALPGRLRPGRGRVRRRSASSPARPRSGRPSCSATSTRCAPARPPGTCFRVTAGLDSMILGEAEIQGQVKRAYELALVEGATGPILNRLFRGALAAGGRAREETGISEKGVSIPSVAVELARRALGDLAERRVLVVGAGETAELVARALIARGVDTVFVANRHYDRAIGLAQRFGGNAVRFEELPTSSLSADIVVSATNSPHHIVERDELAQVMAAARGPPAAADRHRGAARHRARLPRHRRRQPPRRRRRPADRRAQRQRPRGRGAAGGADHRSRARPLRALARLARGGADDRRPARARRRDRAPGAGREREPLGDLGEADRERIETMARAIACRLLHEPTLRMQALGRRRRGLRLRQRPARAVRPRRRDRARGRGAERATSPSCAATSPK